MSMQQLSQLESYIFALKTGNFLRLLAGLLRLHSERH